jgi:hypothetical protein
VWAERHASQARKHITAGEPSAEKQQTKRRAHTAWEANCQSSASIEPQDPDKYAGKQECRRQSQEDNCGTHSSTLSTQCCQALCARYTLWRRVHSAQLFRSMFPSPFPPTMYPSPTIVSPIITYTATPPRFRSVRTVERTKVW